MNPNSTPSLPVHRWVIGKCVLFTLLGLLALDGGLCATNAFADLSISPPTLAFTATVGSPNKTGSVTVTNTGSKSIKVTYADSINWLVAITPGLSQTIQPGKSGTFTLTASFANLAAGSYSGTATISGGGITKNVPITLTLFPASSTGSFSISPSTLAFTATVGSSNKTGSVTVTNTGSTALTVTFADSINWLVAITPGLSQTIQPGLSGTFTLTASFANLAAGSYSGTATISGGGITKNVPVTLTLTLTVAPSTVSFITLTPPAPSIQVHQTQQFVATATDASGTPISGLTFTWRSSTPTVASLDSAGLASGLAQGTATITATNGTVTSNPITLTVAPSTVSFITLTPPAPSIQVHQTQQFVATATDASGTPISGLTFMWASSTPTVASLDSAGLASGLAQGTATITAINGTVTSNQATLTVIAASASPRVYTTNFPLAENPISETNAWINGGATGLDWTNIRTTPGLAFGTETGSGSYDDSIATLSGTWGPNQTVTATVHSINQTSVQYNEVELLLHFQITAHVARGYEINFRCTNDGSQYTEIVRWNGPQANFTYLHRTGGPGIIDGDTVKATIDGTGLISVYINNVLVHSVTDTTWTDGNPGMGWYGTSASVGSDSGFTSYTASDGP